VTSFREVEHTADCALELNATTLELLFADAVYGLMNILFGEETENSIASHTHITFSADGVDRETRLVSLLTEILYYTTRHGCRVRMCTIRFSNEDVYADCIILTNTVVVKEIKAVTFHKLAIIKSKTNHYTCCVVFDV